ncbi:hypothetical protein [Rhizobium sp. ZPR3]|uniref:Uncharacterized protein n=2 Tax=unclassified Rhizobium TaxID=2613769 RepID=A0AAU7S7X8_9HYPH
MLNPEDRLLISSMVGIVSTAIQKDPETDPGLKRRFLQRLAETSHHAASANDLLSMASLSNTIHELTDDESFAAARRVLVWVEHFVSDEGKNSMPPGLTAPGHYTAGDLLRIIRKRVLEKYTIHQGDGSVRTLPAEKNGPFYYAVEEGRLTVASRPAGAAIEGSIANARAALLEQGERLIADLRGSNSQPYLRATLEAVQTKLTKENDIVQLGLLNISLEAAISGATDELNPVLANVLQAHAVGVRHYLAQFPEWLDFSDTAAAVELTNDDVDRLVNAAQELADALEKEELVDEAVPRSLRFVSELHHHPRKQLKRAGLFILRTIENATVAAFRSAFDFVSTAASTAKNKAAVMVGTVFAGAIALVIIHNSAAFVAASDAAWLKPAAEALLRGEQWAKRPPWKD